MTDLNGHEAHQFCKPMSSIFSTYVCTACITSTGTWECSLSMNICESIDFKTNETNSLKQLGRFQNPEKYIFQQHHKLLATLKSSVQQSHINCSVFMYLVLLQSYSVLGKMYRPRRARFLRGGHSNAFIFRSLKDLCHHDHSPEINFQLISCRLQSYSSITFTNPVPFWERQMDLSNLMLWYAANQNTTDVQDVLTTSERWKGSILLRA